MKKILTICLTILILPAALIAGLNFGLINTAKKRVDKIDAKVVQSRTAVAAALDAQQVPTVPTNLTAVAVSSCQISLSWTASADNVGVTGYKIYRNGGATPIATPTGTIYNNTGLTGGTVYSYTVSACDAVGNCSAQSVADSTTTPDTQAPTVPANLMAVAVSSCQINLSWTASIDDVGVINYKIYRDGGATPIATPTGTTYSNTGLTFLTAYAYTVSACDAIGNCSAQSVSASTTTPDTQPPTIPTNLSVVAVSNSQINLSWTASTDEVGVTNYKIYRDGNATPISIQIGTTYNDTGLIAATPYSYTVSACDAVANCSGQSSAVSDTSAPSYPTAGGEWVFVPGSATIGTSDFYVMKYEAKNVGGVATSQAAVIPWTSIDLPTSITACSALGVGYHLLNIAETQTINRNIEVQTANWANGIIGSLVSAGGGLKRGNVGATDSVSYTLAVSSLDYVGAGAGSDRTSTSKAKLILSNGGEIWDWSGNVWEWIYGTGPNGAIGTPNGVTFDAALLVDWSNSVLNEERPILGPSNSSYTSLYGVGQYGGPSTTTKTVVRGGSEDPGAYNGVFAFYGDNAPTYMHPGVGFRCGR